MAQGLLCLNPSCDHQFASSDIQGAAAVTCPKCGNVFQLGGDLASAAVPRAKRVPAPQAARRATPAAPIPTDDPSPFDFDSAQPGALPAAKQMSAKDIPEAKRSGSADTPFPVTDAVAPSAFPGRHKTIEPWKLGIMIGGAIGLVALLCVVVVMLLPFFGGGPVVGPVTGDKYIGQIHNSKRAPEQAFELLLPYANVKGDTWRRNQELKRRLGAVIALERDIVLEGGQTDKVWLAVAGYDYDHQKPRDSELLKRTIEKLEMCFGDRLELEPQPDIGKVDRRTTQVLKFGGEINGTAWRGVCHSFSDKGFGYWIFVAGPDIKTARREFANLHKRPGMGFRVATNRGVWRQRPPELETFVATGAPLRLQAPKEYWMPFKASEEDEHGILFILGKDKEGSQQDPDKNLRNATFLVIDLKKKTADTKEALQAARGYVLDAYRKVRKEYDFELLKEDMNENGTLHAIGKEPGRIVELKLTRPGGAWKYVLVGVIRRPDRIYIIRGECFVEYHQGWRGEFFDILRTVEVFK